MYYYETGIITDFILFLDGNEMWFYRINFPMDEWCKYDANGPEYFALNKEQGTYTRSISKKTVILLGVPLCK